MDTLPTRTPQAGAGELAEAMRTFSSLTALLAPAREIADAIVATLRAGGKILTCGNGGSALEAQHFASELTGHFKRDRAAAAAVALSADPCLLTAIANDYSYEAVFARQIEALARPGDQLLAFTTSGNSPSVIAAIEAAKARGAESVVFSGGSGGRAAAAADRCLLVAATDTARIQEGHLFLVHLICERIDAALADG
jgi:D-sedoheptulose 7-phosphate isomerase